jgi:hypothetical protein
LYTRLESGEAEHERDEEVDGDDDQDDARG